MKPKAYTIPALAVVGAFVTGADPDRVVAAQSSTRTLYVSAIDNKGSVVTDLQPADFDVKVAGKKVEVASAEPAQMPLRIAVIVSDAGTGGFQRGLVGFLQKLLGRAEVSLISVITQPETIVDYSSEAGVLSAGLRRLGPRGRQAGAQLMEAIQDVTKSVASEGRRPAILVLRAGGEATTTLMGDDVREQLRKSGATLYVISAVSAERQQSQARPGISAEQAQLADDEVTSGILNLGQVLGDGSKESGGRHDQVISTTLVPALERVADELLHQYALKCVVPDTVKQTDKLAVASKRKGVKIQAKARMGSW